jgi:hypothetical protein
LHGGEFRLTEAARKVYDKWYESIATVEDKRLDGFVGRKHDHALRTSMCLCAAEMSGENFVKPEHIDASIGLVEGLENMLPEALDGVGSTNSSKAVMNRVGRILAHHTRMNHTDLMRKVAQYANAAEFRQIMDTLMQAGMVGREKNSAIYVWLGKTWRD